VRYITNRSSGKMGYALAKAAVQAGATVTLVSGPVNLPSPNSIELLRVETAAEMYTAVLAKAVNCDIYIGAAAVADYRPLTVQSDKIKKQAQQSTIILEKTKDILAAVAGLNVPPFTLGFAAETNNLEMYAQKKLQEKNLDMIAANWVGREQGGFDSEQNALQIFWKTGQKTLAMMNKTQLAEQLLLLCTERFNEKNST
jgi:phosphopantothenoylcysteine decarboxylase / phosphopantothenate---cysteine ligase